MLHSNDAISPSAECVIMPAHKSVVILVKVKQKWRITIQRQEYCNEFCSTDGEYSGTCYISEVTYSTLLIKETDTCSVLYL